LIENNIFRHNRHGVVLEDGAFCNVIAYNYIRASEQIEELPSEYNNMMSITNSYGDINLHGHNDGKPGATHNLIEGNNCDILAVDTSCGENGEKNVFLRNKADKDGIHVYGYNGFPDWVPGAIVASISADAIGGLFIDPAIFLDIFAEVEAVSLYCCSDCMWLRTSDVYHEVFNNGPIHTFQNQ
jgi:hypothetical protein